MKYSVNSFQEGLLYYINGNNDHFSISVPADFGRDDRG